MANKQTSRIMFRNGYHIGEADADDDKHYLDNCFISRTEVEELTNFKSTKSLLLGRTGSGKTALLRYIRKHHDHVCVLDPSDISFDYIENSDVINFLTMHNMNLSLFFQYLWKHIILSNIIQTYFDSMNKFETILSSLNPKHKQTLDYIKNNGNTFWKTTDEILKEITSGFERAAKLSLDGKAGIDISEISSHIGYGEKISAGERSIIEKRITSEISKLNISDLNKSLSLIDEIMSNNKKQIYICIDDLDTDWVSTKIKYQLIESLINASKAFGKIKNAKIIIALRSDVFDRVIRDSKSEGLQPDKIKGRTISITWNNTELYDLIETRINELFKWRYIKSGIGFYDIFPENHRGQRTIDYIIERTLKRPRDCIAFINEILDHSAGHTQITSRVISGAEATYSRQRQEALCYEWRSVHTCLNKYLSLLQGKSGSNSVIDLISKEMADDLYIDLIDLNESGVRLDDLFEILGRYQKRSSIKSRLIESCYKMAEILFKSGAIKIKLRKGDAFLTPYEGPSIIVNEQFTEDSTYQVHPMLWRSLGITPNIGS